MCVIQAKPSATAVGLRGRAVCVRMRVCPRPATVIGSGCVYVCVYVCDPGQATSHSGGLRGRPALQSEPTVELGAATGKSRLSLH